MGEWGANLHGSVSRGEEHVNNCTSGAQQTVSETVRSSWKHLLQSRSIAENWTGAAVWRALNLAG